ncbi:hypothetical protein P691DRAFT_59138 [Macrolepiota fuliginosa MF-IS2]|uniref:Uncharacterized protein n=1 Tax=Macrolepiota fuliginosa MF-IS2 TaxID=1400762 RepID=A0A9P6BWS5_9AGAR|nr:hypothetical protein P691DRAFT_59138 [Macrolepiota fuliginosa MF-IS2]
MRGDWRSGQEFSQRELGDDEEPTGWGVWAERWHLVMDRRSTLLFRERVKGLKIPEGMRKVVDEELVKLQGLEPAVSGAQVTRNYLDRLTQVRVSTLI